MKQEHIIISQYSIVNNHLAFSPLHLSRTLYKSPLFMQNKPNVKNAQINVSSFITSKYVKVDNWCNRKNKPNLVRPALFAKELPDWSNPIKANFQKAQMNVNSLITKDYRKNDDFLVRINKPNSKPISVKPKMSVNLYVIEDYENETSFRPQKNKPKQTQFKPNLVRRRRISKGQYRLPENPATPPPTAI